MRVTVTVRAEAESPAEFKEQLAGQIEDLQKRFNGLRKKGAFGPADRVELRYLVIGDAWRPAGQINGVPDVD